MASSIGFIIFLLWLITFVGYNIQKNVNTKEKYDTYECGFKSINNFSLHINLSTIVVAMFLILYEFEFFILVPFFFNFYLWNSSSILILVIYIFIINLSLIIDIKFNSIKWIY